MIFKEIKLWDEKENLANLKCYLISNSMEFQQNKKRPAIIICPGGGYLTTSEREGEILALRFASQGYQAFVLEYNTYFGTHKGRADFSNMPPVNKYSKYPQPLYDLGQAMKLIRENAEEWFIEKDKIALCGFSAGGNLVANMGVKWHEEFLSEKLGVAGEVLKPNAMILGYPMIDYLLVKKGLSKSEDKGLMEFWKVTSTATFGKEEADDEELISLSPAKHVSTLTPPSFIWHTATDSLINVSNSLLFASELTKKGVSYELHIFEKGPHGLSLADETTASREEHINDRCKKWLPMAIDFLKDKFN